MNRRNLLKAILPASLVAPGCVSDKVSFDEVDPNKAYILVIKKRLSAQDRDRIVSQWDSLWKKSDKKPRLVIISGIDVELKPIEV